MPKRKRRADGQGGNDYATRGGTQARSWAGSRGTTALRSAIKRARTGSFAKLLPLLPLTVVWTAAKVWLMRSPAPRNQVLAESMLMDRRGTEWHRMAHFWGLCDWALVIRPGTIPRTRTAVPSSPPIQCRDAPPPLHSPRGPVVRHWHLGGHYVDIQLTSSAASSSGPVHQKHETSS